MQSFKKTKLFTWDKARTFSNNIQEHVYRLPFQHNETGCVVFTQLFTCFQEIIEMFLTVIQHFIPSDKGQKVMVCFISVLQWLTPVCGYNGLGFHGLRWIISKYIAYNTTNTSVSSEKGFSSDMLPWFHMCPFKNHNLDRLMPIFWIDYCNSLFCWPVMVLFIDQTGGPAHTDRLC